MAAPIAPPPQMTMRLVSLKDLVHPAVRIGRATTLDVDQCGFQSLGLCRRAAIADDELAVLGLHGPDRRQHGGGAAGERLLDAAAGGILAPLVERVGLLAGFDAEVLG